MDNKRTFRRAGIMLAYPMAYLYLRLIWHYESDETLWIGPTIFSVMFIAFNEIVLRSRKEKSDKRSYFWYVIMILTAATISVTPSIALSFFALHLCAVYSVLISNDILVGRKTGDLIWLDLLCGFFTKTFPNMGMFVIDSAELRKAKAEAGQAKEKRSLTWLIPVLILFPFFFIAMALLSNINDTFGDIVEGIVNKINFFKYLSSSDIVIIILRLIFAVPTCLFLYGLISSSAKSDGTKERLAGDRCRERSAGRRTVSSVIMGVVTGSFVAMYLLFFVVEFNYIFSGLMGRLPEGFNVVDYARKGFFELVGIMAINMFVYVIVNSFEKKVAGKKTVSGYLMIALMIESILFAVVSLSKLLMYFNKFGYTPKRMLAMWGTVILAAAALTVIISVIKGRNHARAWILFTACSYIFMSILSGVLITVNYRGDAGLSVRGEYTVYVDNVSDNDIYSFALYADGEMICECCNADGSPIIPSGMTSYEIPITAEDLPEGTSLRESEFKIVFGDNEMHGYRDCEIRLRGPREEDNIQTFVSVNDYGVAVNRK